MGLWGSGVVAETGGKILKIGKVSRRWMWMNGSSPFIQRGAQVIVAF